jgi:dethiobiotin synthetase
MSLLFNHLRIHQIFGANTDVGKTILTTALVRASASQGHETIYLKPASTGPLTDADDESVPQYIRRTPSETLIDFYVQVCQEIYKQIFSQGQYTLFVSV